MTSSNEERDLRDAYKLGANSYIQKPLDFNRFRDAVKSLGRYWLGINQPVPVVTRKRTRRSLEDGRARFQVQGSP